MAAGLAPVSAFALVGAIGVGSQWLAWRLRLPAIVLMLVAGVIAGPVTGLLVPSRDFGVLLQPMIALAVAIILFEGGLTLNFSRLRDAAKGVQRLVFLGAPLGWLASALALHYVAGLGWETSAVFGGIMIVTGPTVIAPLLRQARLARRPAALMQWEAIVNDPIGALAAVLAFETVLVLRAAETMQEAVWQMCLGVGFAAVSGWAAGAGIAYAFRRAKVPEYMKVPVLFAAVIGVFAASDHVLHEAGLLAVTVMGLVIANADLPSYAELRRFKEHATVLLVSGVFILLAAGLDTDMLGALDWRAGLFVVVVILVARPAVVLLALLGTGLPWREQILVAFTGPRGVVLVAVAGLFGVRLADAGIADGAQIGALAFLLVAVTVLLHGFTLAPLARALGLTAAEQPGVLIIGGNAWTFALAEALTRAEIPVLISDPNHSHTREARQAGIKTYSGDILSESAEHRVELLAYETILAASDNDAYNTLVATDLAPEFGRGNIWQIRPIKSQSSHHALPATLGGQAVAGGASLAELKALIAQGWGFSNPRITDEFSYDDWLAAQTDALLIAVIGADMAVRFAAADDQPPAAGDRLIALKPAEAQAQKPS